MKVLGEHTGYDSRAPVQIHYLSNDARIGMETLLEQLVRKYDDLAFGWSEQTAKFRLSSCDLPEISAHRRDLLICVSVLGGQRLAEAGKGRNALEGFRLLAPFLESSVANGEVTLTGLIVIAYPNQPFSVWVRQRPEQRGADYAEHRRIQTDA